MLETTTLPPEREPAQAINILVEHRYARIARALAQMIRSKSLKVGQRLPSVRETALSHGVSISTAIQAYRQLEEQGLVFARPKAGYFVQRPIRIAQPLPSSPPLQSMALERKSRSEGFAFMHHPADRAGFGGFTPGGYACFDEERLRMAITRAARTHRHALVEYNNAHAGRPALRQAIARRALHLGCNLQSDNIVITASCTQAVSLCLSAITRPGDVVATESPTFFGYLDLIELLGLRVLEIPTHPATGISLPALELALDTQPIKAVLSAPTLSNPLGAVMPLAHKRSLVKLLAERGVPLIEDVVFNDLLAGDERRKAAKAYDTDGTVMICGSFAKTLAPGIRLGWVDAGRWRETIATHKRLQGAPTNVILEEALADLLTQGGYEANLRRLIKLMNQRRLEASALIAKHFPKGTRITKPPSGDTLWLELPSAISGKTLFMHSAAEGITFGPGQYFSATERYQNCLRLSLSGVWNETSKAALVRLGELAHSLLPGEARGSSTPPPD